MDTEKKGKFELQFCSICGQSFETEYTLIKRLNLSHPGSNAGSPCSSHEHDGH